MSAPTRKSESPLATATEHLLAQTLADGANVCVALSGGMDSASLLHAALSLRERWRITACHVNHGISRRADQWENFCRQLCEAQDVPLLIHREKPEKGTTPSEAWARNVRLRAFAKLPCDALLLAHHANDQAETVLFRLLRGTGVHGMAAMRPQTPLSGKLLLRPWLAMDRRVIGDYAKRHGLRWIEDEDNRNLSRRRNFLRWRGLPALLEEFPDSGAVLASVGRRLQDGSDLLMALAEMDEKAARRPDGGLSAAYFRGVGEARTRNWLYRTLLRRRCRFSERHIGEAARQIVCVGARQGLCFNFQESSLRLWRDYLYWWETRQAAPLNFQMDLPATAGVLPLASLGGSLILSERRGGGLSPAKIGDSLSVRLRQGGERLTPPGRHTKAVANLLQEADIQPWRRQCLPFLFAKGQLAAVAGIAIAAEFAAAENETGLDCRFEWQS